MFVLPSLEAVKTQKIKPQLTVGYVQSNEMDERESFTATLNITDEQQGDFFHKLDERISEECRAVFGKKQRIKILLLDGLMKIKIPTDIPVVDANKNLISLDDLRPGDLIVPILRVSSLWSSGSDAGACLKAAKIMLVRHAEPVLEPAVDFAF